MKFVRSMEPYKGSNIDQNPFKTFKDLIIPLALKAPQSHTPWLATKYSSPRGSVDEEGAHSS